MTVVDCQHNMTKLNISTIVLVIQFILGSCNAGRVKLLESYIFSLQMFYLLQNGFYIKEGIEFICRKVLPSLGASNLVNIHRNESTLCISPAQKYLSLCWIKNLTRGCNIEEEKSSLSSVPLNRVMCDVYVS